jgi:hypothetical protein
MTYDLVVIGTGPGVYVCAIKAASSASGPPSPMRDRQPFVFEFGDRSAVCIVESQRR